VKQFDQDSEIAKELLDATDTILLCVAHQSSLVDEILQFSKLDAAMLTLAPHIAQVKWDLSESKPQGYTCSRNLTHTNSIFSVEAFPARAACQEDNFLICYGLFLQPVQG